MKTLQAYACKFCIAGDGLKASAVASLAKTFDEAADHIESEHRYPVRRGDETQDEAEHRVFLRYQRTLLHAHDALVAVIGGPHPEAAQLIEEFGAVLLVTLEIIDGT